jgi:hypothetical protein
MGMKMPVKTVEIKIDTEGYEGFVATARKNFKSKLLDRILEAQATNKLGDMRDALSDMVVSWNFVDEDGKEIGKPSPETLAELPQELINDMFTKISEAVFTVPNA